MPKPPEINKNLKKMTLPDGLFGIEMLKILKENPRLYKKLEKK